MSIHQIQSAAPAREAYRGYQSRLNQATDIKYKDGSKLTRQEQVQSILEEEFEMDTTETEGRNEDSLPL